MIARPSGAPLPIAIRHGSALSDYECRSAEFMAPLRDGVKALRWRKPGKRHNPEPPTLIAKVCPEANRGELWLGPMPREDGGCPLDWFTSAGGRNPPAFAIQIGCLSGRPEDLCIVRGKPQRGHGLQLPDSLYLQHVVNHPKKRAAEVQGALPLVVNSLLQGDNAYVHCWTGKDRGPVIAAIYAAHLHRQSLSKAAREVDELRATNLLEHPAGRGSKRATSPGSLQELGGPWAERCAKQPVSIWEPTSGYAWSLAPNAVVHGCATVEGLLQPLCKFGHSDPRSIFRSQFLTVECAHDAAESGRDLCRGCAKKLPASALNAFRFMRAAEVPCRPPLQA